MPETSKKSTEKVAKTKEQPEKVEKTKQTVLLNQYRKVFSEQIPETLRFEKPCNFLLYVEKTGLTEKPNPFTGKPSLFVVGRVLFENSTIEQKFTIFPPSAMLKQMKKLAGNDMVGKVFFVKYLGLKKSPMSGFEFHSFYVELYD